jgi:hypothetical protein
MDNKARKGPPGGRPRKDTSMLRTEWLKARVTTQEKHRAEQLIRDAKKTESDFVRDAVLEGRIMIKQHRTVDPMLLNELSRIGNNLNQIARVCNTTGDSRRAKAIEDFLAFLRPLLQRLHELE